MEKSIDVIFVKWRKKWNEKKSSHFHNALKKQEPKRGKKEKIREKIEVEMISGIHSIPYIHVQLERQNASLHKTRIDVLGALYKNTSYKDEYIYKTEHCQRILFFYMILNQSLESWKKSNGRCPKRRFTKRWFFPFFVSFFKGNAWRIKERTILKLRR